MATEAQIQANQRNSRLSRGPVTERGKRNSSQNARKHGLRAAREQVLLEEGYRYEERKRKWMSELDPRTDGEEYFAHQQVLTSMMLDGVHAAYIEQATTDIEEADQREDDRVHQLGKRLYFNRAGSAAKYGVRTLSRLKAHTSVSTKSVDPDDPRKLVNQIATSARGCRWLMQEWMRLKERLEGSKFWQAIDRFQAIRLLGKQPTDAGEDRVIAEIYVASRTIEPARKKLDPYAAVLDELGVFRELLGDFSSDQVGPIVEGIRARWPDLLRTQDRERCREILVELVDRELKRYAAKLRRFRRNTEKLGRKSVNNSRFNLSSDGELMRRYVLRYRSSLVSLDRTYDKMRKRELDGERKGGERRACGRPEDGGRRAEGGADRGGRGNAGWTHAGCGPDDDTEWAREIDPGDVQACGGLLPKRTRQGGGGNEEGEASGGVALDAQVMLDQAGDGVVGSGDLGADFVETSAEGSGAAGGAVTSGLAADGTWNVPAAQEADGDWNVAAREAVTAGVAADGTRNVPATQEVDSTWGTADAPIDGSDAEAWSEAGRSGDDGGLDKYDFSETSEAKFDEDVVGLQATVSQEVTADSGSDAELDKHGSAVTNEPKIDEDGVRVQETLGQELMADSGSILGLDNGENEANFERFSVVLTGVESRESEASIGAPPTVRRGKPAGGAGSKKRGRKSKQEQRRERKEMTVREMDRRTRAYLEHGGSIAEGNKLVDDLNDVLMGQFRKLMPGLPRGP